MINTILVEDDAGLAGNIIDFLELENIACDYASTGDTALNLIKKTTIKSLYWTSTFLGLMALAYVNNFARKGSRFRSSC